MDQTWGGLFSEVRLAN